MSAVWKWWSEPFAPWWKAALDNQRPTSLRELGRRVASDCVLTLRVAIRFYLIAFPLAYIVGFFMERP